MAQQKLAIFQTKKPKESRIENLTIYDIME